MRLMNHPRVEEITVEGILYALADPVRAAIYIDVAQAQCPQICSRFLKVRGKELPKSTLSHHFKILRECGLIPSERKGVELLNISRCEELRGRFGTLIKAILEAYACQDAFREAG